jgi:pentatricopeptide repeat protein
MEMNDDTTTSNDKKRGIGDDEPNGKLAKKVKTKHMDQNVLHLRKTIQRCCGTNDLFTALEAYDRLYVKGGTKIEAQTFYNLLNLCEGISRSNDVHIGTPKHNTVTSKPETNPISSSSSSSPNHEFTMEERKYHAFRIKKEMDKLGLALNETSYTAIIRILCKTFDLDEAEKMITQAEQRQQCKPKLRMYSCLISAYCEKDDLIGALRTWARMTSIKRINKTGREEISMELTEREYCTILKCATRLGDVKVIDRVMSEIADEVLVPSLETTNVITEWFESGRALKTEYDTLEELSALDVVINDLPPTIAPSIGPFKLINAGENNKKYWKIEREVSIDTKIGILQSGGLKGKKLKPVALDNNAWKAMMDMNEAIVLKGELDEHGKITEFAGGGKGKKRIVTKEEMEKRQR